MCYSAQIWAHYRDFIRQFGAILDLPQFVDVFWHRRSNPKIKIPRAVEASFETPESEPAQQVKTWIDEFRAAQATGWEQELFKQKKRLADAERRLQTKTTKAALEAQRIATAKIEWLRGKLADLGRRDVQDQDARIFPGHYAPVMVAEGGRRVVKLMRYQCRPAGKLAAYDTKFPGTYNARRDNLEGYWKPLFGYSHGLMVVNAFYENVSGVRADGTTENVVLEFRPQPPQDMLVACLWSRWEDRATGEVLYSFAAITDEPPPEVAAAGHDRCIVPIQPQHIDAWLNPDPTDMAAQYAILDDRPRPYYEHRLAA
ncbi:SOS response-associated peptidase family protein [Caldimonas brevitalea]|uniref:Abasic site processing protein n=1 Tax=Caldimonas brevitalea TaxID=413882 RepID=A0A0G3BND0_9BURK|nr:SOS response-associated peptidase family protein [Caldimonas brevitalea]AKJ30907.1 hypothetical protein AAW51_4216 [Caldimonas brevitalea]